MELHVTINLDNDALEDEQEIARILQGINHNIIAGILHAGYSHTLRDINGNKVGTVTVTG